MSLKSNIYAAIEKFKPNLVLKNGFVINVFDQSIEKNDVAINDDIIVGIGKYEGKQEIDCTGLFISPGFIDSHVHIESSMVTPKKFSQILIKKGVTTAIADPHEIANVMGVSGINFMLDDSVKADMDIFFMMPSCVPAIDFEDNGAKLSAKELMAFIDNDRVLGLGEVMDVPSVINGKKEMIDKIQAFKNRNIDGHCPQISDKCLNAYLCSGISTDHECSSYEEALKKVQRGMYVLIREGSSAKNLKSLVPAVNNNNYHRFLFCTDDRHIEDLINEGSIDYCIRKAIKEGIEPIKAITIATLNAALCYGLKKRGAVAPGYKADLVIFDDLNDINIKNIIKDGILYVDNKQSSNETSSFNTSMNINYIDLNAFKIKKKSEYVNVIKVIPNSIETKKEKKRVISMQEEYVSKIEGDNILKIGVFERHKNTGNRGIGYIDGLGLKNCAIAQTIAHDSHNIIVVGDNDDDMMIAANSVITIGGGIAFVSERKLLEYLALPIAGLMSNDDTDKILLQLHNLNEFAKQYGIKKGIDPFLTLGFMALPVIPEIKITSKGLFDYTNFKFIDLFC